MDEVAGTSLDITGAITASAWVKVNRNSKGFLLAKTDSSFLPNGKSRGLSKALLDAESRNTPIGELLLRGEATDVYFGIYFDGPRGHVNLLVQLAVPAYSRSKGREHGGVNHQPSFLYRVGVLFRVVWYDVRLFLGLVVVAHHHQIVVFFPFHHLRFYFVFFFF